MMFLKWHGNPYQAFSQLDVIYDSYIENYLKFCKRQRRSSLTIANLQQNSFIPFQSENFWASDRNKEHLRHLLRNYFTTLKLPYYI